MSRRYGWAMLGAMVGLVGCQAAPEEHVGYVLLDREAREAGFVVDGLEADRSPVLPIEVDPSDDLSLLGPRGRIALEPEADKLLVVHGATGEVEVRAMGRDVDLDRLVVRGSDSAARELAQVLAGEVAQRDDGSWEIHAFNAFGESSRVRAPADLLEVLPGLTDEGLARRARIAPGERLPSGGSGLQGSVSKAARPSVGIGDSSALAWDALLPPSVSCSDPVAGVWMSHEFHPRLGEWYVFTVDVRREHPGADALVGEIKSEFWEGHATATSAPSCDDEEAVHGVVRMPARGVARGDRVTLDGVTWQAEDTECKHRWSHGYNTDSFTGTLSGSVFNTVNNDGGRSLDDPTNFRRIRCE
jgi:hypothetical protein